MPETLEHAMRTGDGLPAAPVVPRAPLTEREQARRARDDLRGQIGRLELQLGELFATSFPRRGINFDVPPAGGPRVLGLGELERIRDGLASRLSVARQELSARVDVEERNRELVEHMIAAPDEYRWVRVSNEDLGESECRHWHSRPRWGIIGMLLGWWRVKLSSGCPLATATAVASRRGLQGTQAKAASQAA